MAPKVLVQPGEANLEHVLTTLPDLGRDRPRRRHDVTRSQREEDEAENGDMPRGLDTVGIDIGNGLKKGLEKGSLEAQVVERVRVVQLEDVSQVEEGEQEPESLPHPGVEAVVGDVHVAGPLLFEVLILLTFTHCSWGESWPKIFRTSPHAADGDASADEGALDVPVLQRAVHGGAVHVE